MDYRKEQIEVWEIISEEIHRQIEEEYQEEISKEEQYKLMSLER